MKVALVSTTKGSLLPPGELMSRPDVVASSGFIPEADFKELLPSDNIIDDLISRKKVLCFSLCSSICLRTERTCAFSPFLG